MGKKHIEVKGKKINGKFKGGGQKVLTDSKK